MNNPASQTELTQPSPLLAADGQLTQVGWSRQPLLDCNLENARFYSLAFPAAFADQALGLLRRHHARSFLLGHAGRSRLRRAGLHLPDRLRHR